MKYILTVGVTSLIPFEYNGFDGLLYGAKNDAVELFDKFTDRGYNGRILIGGDTISSKFIKEVEWLSKVAKSKDLVVISLSGHGGQMTDDYLLDEKDGKDEYFCFSDRPMRDDEFNYLFSKFKRGVRLMVINDSCHSGTQYKSSMFGDTKHLVSKSATNYLSSKNVNPIKYKAKLKCGLHYIAGCKDRNVSYDGAKYNGQTHGFLSAAVLKYLDSDNVNRVRDLVKFVKRNMPDFQVPKITRVKFFTTYFTKL